MSIQKAVKRASELAYTEDEDQVIGRISGAWCIAGLEDEGRIHQMQPPMFRVKSDGLDAYDVMSAMEKSGIDGDQDWENETTRYELDDELILVSGPCVSFPEATATA